MERYYDAHLYVANWGTHQVMFRLPRNLLDPDVVDDYCVEDMVSAWVTDEYIVLDFTNEDQHGEFDIDHDPESLRPSESELPRQPKRDATVPERPTDLPCPVRGVASRLQRGQSVTRQSPPSRS